MISHQTSSCYKKLVVYHENGQFLVDVDLFEMIHQLSNKFFLVVQKGMGDEEGGWGPGSSSQQPLVTICSVGAGTVALLTMATTWREARNSE